MGSQSRLGLTLPLSGLPLAAQKDLVAGLPELGYTDVWSGELNGIDGFTPLILASQWAPELRLGTAIVGIYTRAPVSLAVQAGTLAALAPGKFVMGIGTSSQVAVEQWNGIPFAQPYQRSRDMLRFLREALAGGKVTREYETFSVNGFRLDPAPEVPPALALAALRPGMLKLAAAEAGIAITNWLAPKDVPRVRAAAGPDCELVARIFVCPTTDVGTARFIGKRMIAAYLTVPVYAAFQQWLGRGAHPRYDPRTRGGVPGARGRVPGGRSGHSRHLDHAGPRPRPRRRHPQARASLTCDTSPSNSPNHGCDWRGGFSHVGATEGPGELSSNIRWATRPSGRPA
jgi:probable F420-dependent oxidoreductase